MDIRFRYTKHQVARATRSDAEMYDKLVLAKNVSSLHATYQIKLLAFRALESRQTLLIKVPKGCKKKPSLREFMKEHPKLIKMEYV